jgi:hypothetical protein
MTEEEALREIRERLTNYPCVMFVSKGRNYDQDRSFKKVMAGVDLLTGTITYELYKNHEVIATSSNLEDVLYCYERM